MAIERPPLVNNEIYHIVLRGVDDSEIFRDKDDYYRCVFSLFEFNDEKNVSLKQRRKERIRAKKYGNKDFSAKRDLLVEILAFCFMPNHIHLLIRQIKDDGITKFMRKFGTGYANYFNKKHNRKGHLFQGRFKAVHIKGDSQLKIVFVYIHTNPIALIDSKWKEEGIKDSQKAIKFIENYKWSSYMDYIGKENFPSVTSRDFLLDVFDKKENCREFVNDWIENKYELSEKILNKVELE